jgi:hypothetical protein
MIVMPSVNDVVNAYEAIEKAWEHYRQTLRACIEEGSAEGKTGRQAEISQRIGRTREALRQDAMTAEQRKALREAEAARRQAAAKKTTPRKRTKS